MYRQSYDSRQRDDHEHRFEEPTEEYFEDGAFIVVYQCDHAPVINSVTDDRRDEVYRETGPRCEVTKTVRLDVSRFEVKRPDGWYTIATSGENVFHDIYQKDDPPLRNQLIEEIEHAIAAAITEEGMLYAVPRLPSLDGTGVQLQVGHRERIVTVDGTERPEGFVSTYRINYDNPTVDMNH